MNGLKLLEMQHDEVDELISRIEATDDVETKRDLFAEVADNLASHAKIEETMFYPAVMAKQTREELLEAVEEHLAIKRVLADMVELDVEDPHFHAKLAVVKEAVRHHAREEEEGELFPKVEKLLGRDELDALGGEMARRFVELIEEEPRLAVRRETAAAAELEP